MSGAADGRGFAAAYSTEAEVMEFVWQERRIAGAHQRFTNGLFYCVAEGCDCDWIPDLKQNRFGPVGQPIELRIGVFNSDDGVLRPHHGAFFHSFDAQRQNSTVFRVKILPAGVIETFRITAKVAVGKFSGFLNVIGGKDFAGKICFYDVLQAGDFGMIEKAAARAHVGIDEARVRRILPPVGELVAVGVEDRIEAKWLDLVSLPDSAALLRWRAWALVA